MGGGGAAVQQARLGEDEGARAERGDRDAAFVGGAQRGEHGRVARLLRPFHTRDDHQVAGGQRVQAEVRDAFQPAAEPHPGAVRAADPQLEVGDAGEARPFGPDLADHRVVERPHPVEDQTPHRTHGRIVSMGGSAAAHECARARRSMDA